MALTAVEFHTGQADPLGFACRLLRKAYRVGSRVQVTLPEPLLGQLDRLLWTAEERDFVPHACWPIATAAVAARSPIWLAQAAVAPDAPEVPRVLVNIGADAPLSLAGFERVIEILGADADAAQAGRARWRAYKGLGLDIRHHAPAGANPG